VLGATVLYPPIQVRARPVIPLIFNIFNILTIYLSGAGICRTVTRVIPVIHSSTVQHAAGGSTHAVGLVPIVKWTTGIADAIDIYFRVSARIHWNIRHQLSRELTAVDGKEINCGDSDTSSCRASSGNASVDIPSAREWSPGKFL
jgi:hypothetical protein